MHHPSKLIYLYAQFLCLSSLPPKEARALSIECNFSFVQELRLWESLHHSVPVLHRAHNSSSLPDRARESRSSAYNLCKIRVFDKGSKVSEYNSTLHFIISLIRRLPCVRLISHRHHLHFTLPLCSLLLLFFACCSRLQASQVNNSGRSYIMCSTQWNVQWKSFNQNTDEFINKVIVWTMMMMITEKKYYMAQEEKKWNWDEKSRFSHSLSQQAAENPDWWFMCALSCARAVEHEEVEISSSNCRRDQFTWVAKKKGTTAEKESESENSTRHIFTRTQPRAILINPSSAF